MPAAHLVSIADLDAGQITKILDGANRHHSLADEPIKKLTTLRGRTVIILMFENSTRTRTSFELAAKRLSAEAINITGSSSSTTKGETLVDTGKNMMAMYPDAIVVRHSYGGAAAMLADAVNCPVINAGDGIHEHPTQALLDVYTLRRRLGTLEGANIWIVGDVLHSRVARSNILAFQAMGATVTVAGPPTLLPRDVGALGVEVRTTLDDLREADVVYALRMQRERMGESYVPSLREYAAAYQIDGRRLGARQLLMHPGPVNRGVELSGDVVDSPQSLVLEQVAAGVVVRMAVLYEVLAQARTGEPVTESQHA